MNIGGYEIDVLVQGFPGKAVCHGGLGWSTIALLRGHGRIALIDTGNFGMRGLLIEQLAQRNIKPAEVTDVLLTHSHYDHAVNWTLFRHARIVIGEVEITWALEVPWGETPVAELYANALSTWPSVVKVRDGDDVLPRVTAHLGPGHTPGCLIFKVKGDDSDVIFTGDAAKNRAELLSRDADMTYDINVSRDTIEAIWRMWREKPGTVVIPGHDVAMQLEAGEPRYLGTRKAALKAWFGRDLAATTPFDLTGGGT